MENCRNLQFIVYIGRGKHGVEKCSNQTGNPSRRFVKFFECYLLSKCVPKMTFLKVIATRNRTGINRQRKSELDDFSSICVCNGTVAEENPVLN